MGEGYIAEKGKKDKVIENHIQKRLTLQIMKAS
jgi:hypothetical protein